MDENSVEMRSARKEQLFAQYQRGEMSIEDLIAAVYRIDHQADRFRFLLKLIVGAFLPILFIGHSSESS